MTARGAQGLVLADFERAAQILGVTAAHVQAVCWVEAPGSGFLASGEPKVLFEAHHFSRLTAHRFDASHPQISSRKWNRALYRGGAAEHQRMQAAAELDREAALQSASWGRFQIMGFHWSACGFASLQDFVNAMYRGEQGHLEAFIGYIRWAKLDDELRANDWDGFARWYNGPGYAEHQYDVKLAQAFARYSKPPPAAA